MTFADYLRKALAAKGMTSAQLARDLGVTRECVDHWRHGRREPRGRELVLLAEALDKHPAFFYGRPEVLA